MTSREATAQLFGILESAGGEGIIKWSTRSAERALGWAAAVEQEMASELHPTETAARLVAQFRAKRHAQGSVGLMLLPKSDDADVLLRARLYLLRTMLASVFLPDKLELWAKDAFVNKVGLKREALEAELEAREEAKKFIHKLGGTQVALGIASSRMLLGELVESAILRNAWETILTSPTCTLDQFTQFAKALEIALQVRQEQRALQNTPKDQSDEASFPPARREQQGPEEAEPPYFVKVLQPKVNMDFVEWAIQLITQDEALPGLSALEEDLLFSLCKADLRVAAKYVSHLVVVAQALSQVPSELQGAKRQDLAEPLRRLCAQVPWVRTFWTLVLEQATGDVATLLRDV